MSTDVALEASSCPLERIAVVVSNGDGDEDMTQVVVRPDSLAALLRAKNIVFGKGWRFEESWAVDHPRLDNSEPKFMAVDGPVWEF